MGEENSILVRLMIQGTEQHIPIWLIYGSTPRILTPFMIVRDRYQVGCDDQVICLWQPLFFSPLFHFLVNPKRTQKNPYCCSKRVEKVYLFEMTLSPVGLVCEGGEAQ